MGKLFGLDYPPGAANDPNAPWNQQEGPCEVCGKQIDYCICPECPICGAQGDGYCYMQHGLILTDEQKSSKERADREAREADEKLCREEMRLERLIERSIEEEPNYPRQKNGCNCAYSTDEFHGWGCTVTDGSCEFIYPDAVACAKRFGEGPLSDFIPQETKEPGREEA